MPVDEGGTFRKKMKKFLAFDYCKGKQTHNLAVVERFTIQNAIDSCGGDIPSACLVLGISRTSLYRKINSWVK